MSSTTEKGPPQKRAQNDDDVEQCATGAPNDREKMLHDTTDNQMLKLGVFILLVLQTTTVVLVIRYSQVSVAPDKVYVSSTAVVCGEALKVLLCFGQIMYVNSDSLSGIELLKKPLQESILENPMDSLKMAVPAVLFAVQNNLLFYALANLQASVYQILYQIKILTTAMFLVVMLQKEISTKKWAWLFLLFCGVSLTQLKFDDEEGGKESNIQGIMAILGACCTSGFAGVYMEKVVKGSAPSIFVRNVQLGVFGIISGLFIVVSKDFDIVANQGFFANYTALTWFTITLHSLGGILIACVIKYADNLIKTIATSLSVVLSSVISWMFLGFVLTPQFAMGAILVLASAYGYSTSP